MNPNDTLSEIDIADPDAQLADRINLSCGVIIENGTQPPYRLTGDEIAALIIALRKQMDSKIIRDALNQMAALPKSPANDRDIRAEVISECAACVPTTWLDPLLSGPDAAADGWDNCPAIERLLKSVAARIRALPSG